MSEPTRQRTLWQRGIAAPIRAFLRTESASAGVLVAAIVLALLWSNVDNGSYEGFWRISLSVRLGGTEVAEDLRTWVNSGLMTLFFLVVGLEARREFDLGDFRDRRRFLLPFSAGLVGLALPALIYTVVNLGGPGAHGWGVAMSTDTALALGLLTLLGRGVPDRVRVFLLTVFVVDDLVSLLVIAIAYSEQISVLPLVIAVLVFVVLVVLRVVGVRSGVVHGVLGVISWLALLESGVDPVVVGLGVGLATSAYTPARDDLERATGLFRLFREQPTAELAREATAGLNRSLSPNSRLQNMFHPWTSYVIVPLFGLANAGVAIDGNFLVRAYTSPVTLGIILGYVVGKPVAVVGTSWLITRFSRIRPPVGWLAVVGSGTIAGIGFTVSLLIATLALRGPELDQAKVGVLTAVLLSSGVTWAVYRTTRFLSPKKKALALLGTSEQLIDLVDEVDPSRDHIRGPADASVTVVEYGDFECPYCGLAEPVVRDLLADTDLRYVWRHLPLTDVHPRAQLAAEAAEAAAAQGAFWPMHDLLMQRQENLRIVDLLSYADELDLDRERFHEDLKRHQFEARIAQDVQSADLSGVSGTPTFFINGQRHYGSFDLDTLSAAVKTARARAAIERHRARSA
ncbi:Na+/H+ antiporter NhaA [Kutzneria kofuensis]|uniref:Na(+)/H(+) antiporter NhaA n=1 Tax=Kutzneria kofuensis TaxID=103725 RepID=A0A7W9NGN8_9PSEU|nr:Na+/H+ antiporter NhaA [Kutzneria kofuensis]MBB5891263.1 Na+/H+ antiporter NhaA [Kutzneria kofuensis]